MNTKKKNLALFTTVLAVGTFLAFNPFSGPGVWDRVTGNGNVVFVEQIAPIAGIAMAAYTAVMLLPYAITAGGLLGGAIMMFALAFWGAPVDLLYVGLGACAGAVLAGFGKALDAKLRAVITHARETAAMRRAAKAYVPQPPVEAAHS